jgi:serine/threonine-protein kinase SRPK3
MIVATNRYHSDKRAIDVKPENLSVSLGNVDDKITKYIEENPSSTYDPVTIPEISPEPFITTKTLPLPDFGLDPSLNNLQITLGDYGNGERFLNTSTMPISDPT